MFNATVDFDQNIWKFGGSTLLNVTLQTLVEEFSSLDFLGNNSFILNHAIRDGGGESTFVMDCLFIRY